MHPANCLGFGFLFNGCCANDDVIVKRKLTVQGNSHFLTDESDKSTSGKKLLQPSNHSTPTINVAGERHSMMGKFAFQGCIAAFLLFSLAQGMCNKLSSPVQ